MVNKKEYKRQYRLDNKEKIKEYHIQWCLNNPEHKEQRKQYCKDNHERREEYMKKWREVNIKHLKKYSEQYRLTHKEEIKECEKRYYKTDEGRANNQRKSVKRRGLGFNPLNEYFEGAEAHHINKNDVIYMLKELHRSIHHCLRTGRNMGKINKLAMEYAR